MFAINNFYSLVASHLFIWGSRFKCAGGDPLPSHGLSIPVLQLNAAKQRQV